MRWLPAPTSISRCSCRTSPVTPPPGAVGVCPGSWRPSGPAAAGRDLQRTGSRPARPGHGSHHPRLLPALPPLLAPSRAGRLLQSASAWSTVGASAARTTAPWPWPRTTRAGHPTVTARRVTDASSATSPCRGGPPVWRERSASGAGTDARRRRRHGPMGVRVAAVGDHAWCGAVIGAAEGRQRAGTAGLGVDGDLVRGAGARGAGRDGGDRRVARDRRGPGTGGRAAAVGGEPVRGALRRSAADCRAGGGPGPAAPGVHRRAGRHPGRGRGLHDGRHRHGAAGRAGGAGPGRGDRDARCAVAADVQLPGRASPAARRQCVDRGRGRGRRARVRGGRTAGGGRGLAGGLLAARRPGRCGARRVLVGGPRTTRARLIAGSTCPGRSPRPGGWCCWCGAPG